MYYCKSRYYVPEWCRWLNADDVSYLQPKLVNGLNLFAYCYNNPTKYMDHSGCFPVPASDPLWSKSGKSDRLSYGRVVRPNLKNDIMDVLINGIPNQQYYDGFGAVGKGSGTTFGKAMYIMGYAIQSFTSVDMFSYDASFLSVSATGLYIADASFTGGTLRIYTNNDNDNSINLSAASFSLGLGADIAGTFGLSMQGTIVEVGYSTENFDADLLVGSFGLDVKLTKNSFTFGFSYIFGLKFTIRW